MMRRGAVILAAGLSWCWPSISLASDPSPKNDAKPSIGSLLSAIARTPQPAEADASNDALQALVTELDSEVFETRERATDLLTTDESISASSLEALAGQGGLSPEAHSRVLEALRRRFIDMPRPAIGISMNQPVGPEGVGIAGVSPAFPAANVLQTDDVVAIIAGVPLENTLSGSELLRDVVRSFLPDEEIPMTVVRAGERLHLRVPLGRYEDLQQGAIVNPDELSRAWDIRIRRRGLIPDDGRVIEVAVPRGSWFPQRRGAYDTGTEGGLVAGGQASARQDQPIIMQASGVRWRDANARDRAGFRAAENPINVNAVPVQQPRAGLREMFLKRVEDMQQQIKNDSEQLADPRLTDAERARLRESIIQRSRELQQLADQLGRFPPMP